MEDLFIERQDSQMPKIQKGIRFCADCQNMLIPREEDKMLTFICRSCDYKVSVKDQNSEVENLIYKKDIKIQSNKALANHNFVIDPTMARTKDVTCPKCYHGEAIYYMTSDFEDSKLIKQFICAKLNNDQAPACGFVWTSEDNEQTLQNLQQDSNDNQNQQEGRQNIRSQQSNLEGIEEESMEGQNQGGYNLNEGMENENYAKQQSGPLVDDDEFLDSEEQQQQHQAEDDEGEEQYQMENEEDQQQNNNEEFFGKDQLSDDEDQGKIEN